MSAVATVLGIGIFVGLLLAFPRRMLWLLAALAGLAVVLGSLIAGYNYWSGYARQRDIDNLNMLVSWNPTACSVEYPLLVGLQNETGKELRAISFRIEGFRLGYSSSVTSWNNSYSSDKIVPSGEGFALCWQHPPLSTQIDDLSTIIWTVKDILPTFG